MGKATGVFGQVSAWVLSALLAAPTQADVLTVSGESVTLAAIVPALSGTELGDLEVAEAPRPGQRRTIRGSDVKRALREHGQSARGLRIPSRVTVTRKQRKVSREEVAAKVRASVAAGIAPCELVQLSLLSGWALGAGDYEVSTRLPRAVTSGRRSLVVWIEQGGQRSRISAQVELSCPAPVVAPGASVRLLAHTGAVRVSAPGKALQAGRVGDEIRVTNQVSRKTLLARVVDAQTVEVLP